jgi:hypothetical protein
MPKDKVQDEVTPVTELDPQGSVIEPTPVPGGGFDLRPTAGYNGHYPVQFSDESDQTFAERVAMFESSYASAAATERGGEDLASAKSALEAKYKAELLALERRFSDKAARRTVNGVPTSPVKSANSRVVKTADGKTKGVDAKYELEKGEKFV